MENLDRYIRYFLKVAELSSLSQAAEALDRTQSGLSRQLAALESFLGKPLFIRTGRGMTLTDAGEKLRKGVFVPYQLIDGKRMGNYIPLPTSSTNFFRNGVDAVSLRCHPVVRQ